MTVARRFLHHGLTGVLTLATWLNAAGQPSRLEAQAAPAPLSYTAAQAERGQAHFAEHCASCHGQNLDDGPFAPPLKGAGFRRNWPETADALLTYMSAKMPPDGPGTLGDQVYADLLAFMLRENGSRPGASELPTDPEAIKAMAPPSWPRIARVGGLASGVTLPPPPPRVNPLDTIRPVTDAMLTNPPEDTWISWRRTYNAFGFSPLEQINTSNVAQLRVAWSWSLPNGPNQATPLVHDGVLFVHSFGDNVQALDAVTGDLLWQYSRRLPAIPGLGVKRSISLYGGLLYLPTSDVHVVALDVKTGKVVWDKAVGDPQAGFGMTGGPLVARGKVMIGTTDTAARSKGGNYIVGLDAATGEEMWRFYVVARPDEPGGHTWNGLPLEKRNGGSVWIPGSYDPVNNLALFGIGNTYDTIGLRDPIKQEGITNDALYLDSTVALDPDTGKLVWYFQHQANDQWDLDWAFERQVMELPVNGVMQKIVLTAGKQMIFDALDVKNGRYLFSFDMAREIGMQNVVTAIDPRTGAKIVDPNLIPGDGKTKTVCPYVDGGRDWMPTSYDARTRMLYVPWVEACMDLVPVGPGERGPLSTGVRWVIRPRDGTDGKYGRLEAIDLNTKKTAWVHRQRAPMTSGVLATAGGLVFAGSLDRTFAAHDAATGEQLWKLRLNDVPASVPITYSVKGRQYVATVVGPGGPQTNAYGILIPETKNPPDHGAAIWVFEVPSTAVSKATEPR